MVEIVELDREPLVRALLGLAVMVLPALVEVGLAGRVTRLPSATWNRMLITSSSDDDSTSSVEMLPSLMPTMRMSSASCSLPAGSTHPRPMEGEWRVAMRSASLEGRLLEGWLLEMGREGACEEAREEMACAGPVRDIGSADMVRGRTPTGSNLATPRCAVVLRIGRSDSVSESGGVSDLCLFVSFCPIQTAHRRMARDPMRTCSVMSATRDRPAIRVVLGKVRYLSVGRSLACCQLSVSAAAHFKLALRDPIPLDDLGPDGQVGERLESEAPREHCSRGARVLDDVCDGGVGVEHDLPAQVEDLELAHHQFEAHDGGARFA